MLKQQKAVASVTPGVLPNKNRVLSPAPVSYVSGQDGSQESRQSVSWRLTCYTKTQTERDPVAKDIVLSPECFDSLNSAASKQPERKTKTCTEICCWKLFTFTSHFLFYCDTGCHFFELRYCLRCIWKDVDQRQDGFTGKRLPVLF